MTHLLLLAHVLPICTRLSKIACLAGRHLMHTSFKAEAVAQSALTLTLRASSAGTVVSCQ